MEIKQNLNQRPEEPLKKQAQMLLKLISILEQEPVAEVED